MAEDSMQSKGGKARAEALTPEQRKEIGRKGAEARWGSDGEEVEQATHGSPDHPLRIGSYEIPCYVLKDGRRVLHQRGMVKSLGMSRGSSGNTGGDRLAKFVAGKALSPFVSDMLLEVTANPIKFRTPRGAIAYGYEATVLSDLCDVVLKARAAEKLQDQQQHIAAQCEILMRGFAKVGIIALVDEATGYQSDRAKDALAKILEQFIAKELRAWTRTFPVEFYQQIFRLKKWPFDPSSVKRPSVIGHYTNNFIYKRLAPGVLGELRKKNPVVDGRRKNKFFQWLTGDIGDPKLRSHIEGVMAIMRGCESFQEFKKMLNKFYPIIETADLGFDVEYTDD